MSIKDRTSTGTGLLPARPLATARRWAALLKQAFQPTPPWMKEKSERDRLFDERFQVETSLTSIAVLRIDSDHRAFARDHVASDTHELEAALDSLSELPSWTFVDLGSGKGRAVLVASLRPFRRIIGVEFAPALHAIAEKNVSRFPRAEQRCAKIDLHCGDAAAYDLPCEDTVLFMYNPFGPEVMSKVVARTVASLAAHPRRLLVLYSNPLHAEPWRDAGFVAKEDRDNFLLLLPPPHLRLTNHE